MAGCYGKGGREQVKCGHVNGVPRVIVNLTCAKARPRMAIRMPACQYPRLTSRPVLERQQHSVRIVNDTNLILVNSVNLQLTDLSKAFDCISHDLLIAKLQSCGFSINSLSLIKDYLSDRIQRKKIGETLSMWREIVYGVPQGSILGPLLFNIYINDIFLFSHSFNIANYADDCSLYEFTGSIDDVIQKLENDSRILMNWDEINYLKPNPDKWHLLLSEIGGDMRLGTPPPPLDGGLRSQKGLRPLSRIIAEVE